MADILQTTFSDALSGVKNIVCETKLQLPYLFKVS